MFCIRYPSVLVGASEELGLNPYQGVSSEIEPEIASEEDINLHCTTGEIFGSSSEFLNDTLDTSEIVNSIKKSNPEAKISTIEGFEDSFNLSLDSTKGRSKVKCEFDTTVSDLDFSVSRNEKSSVESSIFSKSGGEMSSFIFPSSKDNKDSSFFVTCNDASNSSETKALIPASGVSKISTEESLDSTSESKMERKGTNPFLVCDSSGSKDRDLFWERQMKSLENAAGETKALFALGLDGSTNGMALLQYLVSRLVFSELKVRLFFLFRYEFQFRAPET